MASTMCAGGLTKEGIDDDEQCLPAAQPNAGKASHVAHLPLGERDSERQSICGLNMLRVDRLPEKAPTMYVGGRTPSEPFGALRPLGYGFRSCGLRRGRRRVLLDVNA